MKVPMKKQNNRKNPSKKISNKFDSNNAAKNEKETS